MARRAQQPIGFLMALVLLGSASGCGSEPSFTGSAFPETEAPPEPTPEESSARQASQWAGDVTAQVPAHQHGGPDGNGQIDTKPTRPPAPQPIDPVVVVPPRPTPPPGQVVPEAIEIEVLQSSSESWWRNCLLARTPHSEGWVQISCNKGANSNTTSAFLPGIHGTCNAVSIRMETYRNIGSECSQREQLGLPCEGPYPLVPDVVSEPGLDASSTSPSKSTPFALYHADNASDPDPLIRSYKDWQVPDFSVMAAYMRAWLGKNPRNRWFRFFFEDQRPSSISSARAQPDLADDLGVDYNDYVVDIQSNNIEIGIAGTDSACP
jgi:hypothetical protein